MKGFNLMFPDRLYLRCSITEKDIKNGQAGKCGKCPAALAICHALVDEFVEFSNVEVYSQNISIECPNSGFGKKIIRAKTPRSVSRFIKKFDNNEKVQPMNFVLRFKNNG